MKRLAVLTLTVAATLIGVVLLWQFRTAIILFALSLAVAGTLRPLIEFLAARRWPRPLALLSVYGLSLVVVSVIGGLVIGSLVSELSGAAGQFVAGYAYIWAHWPTGTALEQALIHWLPPPASLVATASGPGGVSVATGLFGVTSNLLEALGQLAVVVVMSLYWGIDQAHFERLWLSVLPAGERTRAREIWRAIETGVGAYIRSELVQCLLAGLLLGVGYRLAGLPYPTLLAVVSALALLIPWLGAAFGLAPVLLVGWVAGPAVTVVAGVYTLLVFVLLQYLVEPRLYVRRQHSSLLIAILAICLVQAYGVLGLLAAPPLAAALEILVGRLLVMPGSVVAVAATAVDERYAGLEQRLAGLTSTLSLAPEPPAPHRASLVARLQGLLAEAGPALAEEEARAERLALAARSRGRRSDRVHMESTPRAR
jgi:predicted PurR-regulated permease PerM